MDAVLCDLQRSRTKVPHRSEAIRFPTCSVLTTLRVKYGAAVKECVKADVAVFARFYELVDPLLTAVYAESPDERRERHDSIETLAAHWETLQLNVTLSARLCGDVRPGAG